MGKKRDVKIQPLKPTQLSEEERQLHLLRLQYREVVSHLASLKGNIDSLVGHVRNLEKDLVRLGRLIERLRQQAELRRVEKQVEKKS